MKRVVVDAFGGDYAPTEIIKGCVDALAEYKDLLLILCGDEAVMRSELQKYKYDSSRIDLCHAPEIISIQEAPVMAVRRKKNSSLVRALETVANKEADVFISAGSSGAILAGATFIVKRIKGVKRPALAPLMPTLGANGALLLDSGANVDCKPQNLQQFALMGSAYMEKVMGVHNPRVGLINNGAESEKGCELTKAAYKLLQSTPINFIGNCEARDIMSGDYDVVVADGFVGNVALKATEGAVSTLLTMLKQGIMDKSTAKIGASMLKPVFAAVKKRMDYSENGGALLLGINGGIIKMHGSSKARAVFSAIRQARNFIDGNVVQTIRESISALDISAE